MNTTAVITEGGTIDLTTGAGGTFTDDGGNSAGISGLYSGTSFEGSVANAGNITSADDMIIDDVINAAGTSTDGIVTLKAVSAGQVINLGTTANAAPAGTLGLSDAELGMVTASLLRIGSMANTGGIIVTAAGVGTTNAANYGSTLSLITGGGITEPTGTLTIANLAVQSVGPADLQTGFPDNHISTLAANVTGAGASFLLNDDAAVPLSVGTVDGVNGITTNDGPISLFTGQTTITDTPAALDVSSRGASISITGTFTNDANAVIDIAGGQITISSTSDTLMAGSSINSHAGRLVLYPASGGNLINLGGANAAGQLGLTAAELNTLFTTGVLQIGNSSQSTMTISAPIAPAHATTLDLETGGAITDNGTAADTITIASLVLRAAAALTWIRW